MPFPFTLACRLLLLVIGICNVISIVILSPDIVAHTARPLEAVALASNIVALLIFLITFSFLCCRRHAESSNTRNIATFGALWLSDVTSCVLLTIHARQNHATALCHDLSQSGDCTMANVLLAVFYMASIFGLVGLVLASRDKHPGITKVSPRYPITKAASSHFTAFQHPLDPELENAYPKSSSKKAEHMKEGHTHERWTEIPL